MNAPSRVEKAKQLVEGKARTAGVLTQVGIVRPMRPDRLVKVATALRTWGPTPAAGYTVNAARRPDKVGIIDDEGPVTFREIHEASNALAHELGRLGVKAGDGLAVMCRNHRGFVLTVVAASKLGANCLFLNTMFSGPQIRDVLDREDPRAIVYDAEFEGLVEEGAASLTRVVWRDADHDGGDGEDAGELVSRGDRGALKPPAKPGKVVILTSGTTGTPKGASRQQPKSLDPAAQLFSKIPLRAEEPTMLSAPIFHSWGYMHWTLGFALGSTLVMRRRFKPDDALATAAKHGATALIVVPVMLQRIMELSDEEVARHDLSRLRIIALSGAALPGELATRTMDRFGDVVYNLYGSTEVAWATIATPKDLRAAPGTAGRPPYGTTLKLYDDDGNEVTKQGDIGRIFVGNDMRFEGYTGGGGKDAIDGLLSSGDVGHIDEEGRLFIDGRDDDMIVSGGENVFPREIEDLLADHEAVEEAAVIGVDDDDWGQRLKAFVVLRDGKDVSEDDLKGHVKSNLASYKTPREIEFLDELPRNATGKVLKRELRDDDDGGDDDGSDHDAQASGDAAEATSDDAATASGNG